MQSYLPFSYLEIDNPIKIMLRICRLLNRKK